ncbi:MAG: hypothetical protein R3E32_05430 [Chitinophagales bacterium]
MKQKQLLPVLFAIISLPFNFCFAFEGMESYFQQNEALESKSFLQHFPFETYLEQTKLSDYQTLEKDRQLLNEKGKSGNEFITILGEKYLQQKPVNINNFKQTKNTIEVGWLYLKALNQITPKHDMSFDILGDYLLSQIAEKVEAGIKEGTLEIDNWQTRFYVQRLEDCNYFIDIPKSNLSKLLFHVQHHNWGYIWSRVRSRYLVECMLVLMLPLALFALYFRKKKGNLTTSEIIQNH